MSSVLDIIQNFNEVIFMKEFGRNKIALFLTCMSILGNRTSAMNTNKVQNPQTVAAVGRVTSRNNQSVKQGLTKNQKWAIGAAVSLAVVSAAGFTIWGVKRHNDKKLLESALAFLNSGPVVVSASKKYSFDVAVDVWLNTLTLFKDGKMDELKKNNIEVEIGDGSIVVKTTLLGVTDKFVISKIDDESWNVKKYKCNIKEGKEELEIEVKLGIGKFKTIESEEEKIGKAVSDRFRKFDTLDKQFKSFKAPDEQFESFKASTNKGNQEIDDSSNKDENDKNDVDAGSNELEEYEKQFDNMPTFLGGTRAC